MKSLFFDIKRYAINDGPGIRITIFLKGCPLSCLWCHNPEGISPKKEKLYTRSKCLGCQACVQICKQKAIQATPDGMVTDRSLCTLCGACADVCPTFAMEISGKPVSVDELMREIEKETLFMDRSEGGVTFCGGEPLMHREVLVELLRRCGQLGIHRAVDTTLYAGAATVNEVMQHTDLFLVDLKHMDAAKHQYFCGTPNQPILSNIRLLAEAGKEIVIRIPLIEGVNADEENITETARFLASLPKRYTVNLLLYHDIGKGKHQKLGTSYNPDNIPMRTPSKELQKRCLEIFRQYGIEATV
ncbi:glycyl-radical enzyme activating protein [Parabacteroides sp. PF5-6]|uniref:glycyl-radical enzyme activating protein n=1 Tax=Parabacteroides sp. PF5-6 TaxID=1742403 RepID=UPI0024063140|nr:glycyl-radical enzyme activating protein [Parabacteroides sp. PF5-6]MDF9829166.1 pyruvate formate lyase activating enzyme [Parabacteroides sp. PF5-6]